MASDICEAIMLLIEESICHADKEATKHL
jgi:hypothetical protein